jgi:uncharacterized caspase-like protein
MAAKSFEEIVGKTRDTKVESDLQNLANALLYAKQSEQEAVALQKRITDLAKRIENGVIVGVDEVHNLYSEAIGDRRRKPL